MLGGYSVKCMARSFQLAHGMGNPTLVHVAPCTAVLAVPKASRRRGVRSASTGAFGCEAVGLGR